MFPNKDRKRDALKMLTDTTSTADRRPDNGQPRTVRTTAVIHQVEDLPVRKAADTPADTQNCVLCVCRN